MAKIYGINGVITGKLGAAVYAVRNGEQISRQYQPIVANPQTENQTAARAKLKLMSQLSAVIAPAIGMEKEGAVSSRNLFVKKNYPLATYASDQADIQLASVQLTNSSIGMPRIGASRGESGISVGLDTSVGLAYGNLDADEVVYTLVTKGLDSKLRLVDMKKVSKNTSPVFLTTFDNVATECVIFAYAIRYNSENARVSYGDITATAAETVAKLLVSRAITSREVTLTETTSATLAATQA